MASEPRRCLSAMWRPRVRIRAYHRPRLSGLRVNPHSRIEYGGLSGTRRLALRRGWTSRLVGEWVRWIGLKVLPVWGQERRACPLRFSIMSLRFCAVRRNKERNGQAAVADSGVFKGVQFLGFRQERLSLLRQPDQGQLGSGFVRTDLHFLDGGGDCFEPDGASAALDEQCGSTISAGDLLHVVVDFQSCATSGAIQRNDWITQSKLL